MCLPQARRSKYSTRPTTAFAVHEPSWPWSSIGENQLRRSTAVGSAAGSTRVVGAEVRQVPQPTHAQAFRLLRREGRDALLLGRLGGRVRLEDAHLLLLRSLPTRTRKHGGAGDDVDAGAAVARLAEPPSEPPRLHRESHPPRAVSSGRGRRYGALAGEAERRPEEPRRAGTRDGRLLVEGGERLRKPPNRAGLSALELRHRAHGFRYRNGGSFA